MPRMTKLYLSIFVSCVQTPVWAHHGGVSTFRFVDGLMHPWSGFDHWLILLGLVLVTSRRLSVRTCVALLTMAALFQGVTHIHGIGAEAFVTGYVGGLALSNVLLIGTIASILRMGRYLSALLTPGDSRVRLDRNPLAGLN